MHNQVKVFKNPNAPTHIVQIRDDVYEMSENANEANGVNMYLGPVRNFKFMPQIMSQDFLVSITNWPAGIRKGIASRIAQVHGQSVLETYYLEATFAAEEAKELVSEAQERTSTAQTMEEWHAANAAWIDAEKAVNTAKRYVQKVLVVKRR